MHKNSSIKILPGAEQLFIPGNKSAFLFVHGFTGSPFEGREIAKRIHSQFGFTVSVPLLPGHGTRAEDLIGVHWQDWYQCVDENYEELRKTCDKIYICGMSMGGALSLYLASQKPVAAVISLAGPAFLKDWRLRLLPIARHIITFQHKSKGPDVKMSSMKAKIPSYHKYPVKSVDELLKLLRKMREGLSKVNAPVLLVYSRFDRTVHFDNLAFIESQLASDNVEKMILENSYHLISLDFEKDKVTERIVNFIKTVLEKDSK